MRSEPLPVSYRRTISSRGVMISASVGKSGACTMSHSSSTGVDGFSSSLTQAAATSRRLCGGMSVAMPTAMPVAPLSSTCGRRAGRKAGSFRVPSKLGVQSTVPWAISESSMSANGVRRASV